MAKNTKEHLKKVGNCLLDIGVAMRSNEQNLH